MTTDEMIVNLQGLLGNIGTILDARMLVELKLAQTKAERGPILPWFLIKNKYATIVGEPRVALDTDFLRETEMSAYYVVNEGRYYKLLKDDLDDLRPEYEHQDNGFPKYYGLLNGYLWAYPKPDSAYRVEMQYATADTVLATGDSGNLWSTHYPDLLIGLAGQNLAVTFRALDVKPRFDDMVKEARTQMLMDNTAREVVNFEASYGGG
jgi:hypothetical protein